MNHEREYSTMNYEKVLNKTPIEFISWIETHFLYETFPHMETKEDVERGLDMMNIQARMLETLATLLSYAKIRTRDLKRGGAEKKLEYEDMVDKKEIIENTISAIKISYQTTNKCITVFIETNRIPQEHYRK